MSSLPNSRSMRAKTPSICSSLVTSQAITGALGNCSARFVDVLLQALALVGEGQLAAGLAQRLGDGPGQRALVGHAEDQRDLSGQVDRSHLPPPRPPAIPGPSSVR